MGIQRISIMENLKLLKNKISRYIYYKRRDFSFKFPYLGYVYDSYFNKIGNSVFYNFRPTYKDDFWLKDFVKNRGIISKEGNIAYISVFGPRSITKYIKDKKIFFCTENVGKNALNKAYKDYDDYLLDDVNLSIGFREYDNDNYIRFPLWITQLIDPYMNHEDIKKRIEEINDRENLCRDKFCCLIARHDTNGERGKAYNELKKIGNIDCPSSFNHNIDVELPNYDDKRKFMEDYRFNICLENHSVKGYITEKLIDAFRSKCIPIYNGIFTDFEKSIINEEAIINTLDKNWIKKVEEIETNKNKYKEFIHLKPFKEGAIEILCEHIDLLDEKIRLALK